MGAALVDMNYLAEELTAPAKEAIRKSTDTLRQRAAGNCSRQSLCVQDGGASDDSRAPTLSLHVYIQYHVPWDLKH